MEEINKRTLIESLSALPEYDPPENLWEGIENRMEEPYAKLDLRELPTYEPPEGIWGKIEHKLEGKRVKLTPRGMRHVLAVAASLALILTAYWVFNQEPLAGTEMTEGEYTISYSSEVYEDALFDHDWNEDEAAFEEFKELCEAKKYICEHPEFQILKADLDELTDAKEVIQEAIGSYGTDPELVTQIKEIELERTDILKKMMVMLI